MEQEVDPAQLTAAERASAAHRSPEFPLYVEGHAEAYCVSSPGQSQSSGNVFLPPAPPPPLGSIRRKFRPVMKFMMNSLREKWVSYVFSEDSG